ASGSLTLSLDPMRNRYLSYGAMVVPSNDAFLGNESPTIIELFDANGDFIAQNFAILGSQIWDAGTEVNQLLGAAYIVGEDASAGVTENGMVQLADLSQQFSAYVGSAVPSGGTFQSAPSATAPLAAFSFAVVPEPAALSLAAVSVAVVSARRRSRRRD
ncbi:MAG: spondin domain-containing protein, partial [Planctomycetales bacterium]|nr:spondin domain-containing protein [Planctomycetales bacterium]